MAFCTGQALAGNGHWEFWSETTASMRTDAKTQLRLDKAVRFHRGSMYYTHSDLHLRRKLRRNLKTGIGYRLVKYRSGEKWKTEHRPYGLVVLSSRAGSFNTENRHKLEYRMKQGSPGQWRYRTRLKVGLPVKIGGTTTVEPYLSDEIFVNLNGAKRGDIYRNRLYTGIGVPLGKDITAEFYYLAQTQEIDLDEGEVWRNYNVIGLKLKFEF